MQRLSTTSVLGKAQSVCWVLNLDPGTRYSGPIAAIVTLGEVHT